MDRLRRARGAFTGELLYIQIHAWKISNNGAVSMSQELFWSQTCLDAFICITPPPQLASRG